MTHSTVHALGYLWVKAYHPPPALSASGFTFSETTTSTNNFKIRAPATTTSRLPRSSYTYTVTTIRVFFINNCAHKTPEAAAPRVAGYTASTYPVH